MPTIDPRQSYLFKSKGFSYKSERSQVKKTLRKTKDGPIKGFLFQKEKPDSLASITQDYVTCTACPLHETAGKHVVYDGPSSPLVLFIGEAPGWTEDLVGRPLIGPAGQLFRKMIKHERLYNRLHARTVRTRFTSTVEPLCGIANTVCCVPWKSYEVTKETRSPKKEEATACRPHLDRLITLLRPKLIVQLGGIAKTLFKYPKGLKKKSPDYTPTILHLEHPSSILRSAGEREPEETPGYRRWILTLEETLNSL